MTPPTMSSAKTNERPGTRAVARDVRMSATKARAVLDLIRNASVDEARDVLTYTDRTAAEAVGKALESAVANAENNDQIDPETLFVSACYADEGRTLYRFRPRARGRATRIRKRTCHITIIVSPMSAEMLAAEQAKREAIPGSRAARRRGQDAAARAARVAASQQADDDEADDDDVADEIVDEAVDTDGAESAEEATDAVETDETDEVDDTVDTDDDTTVDTDDDAEAEADDAAAEADDDAADDDGTEEN